MPVRPAREVDFPAVLAIVNREIAEGTAHFGSTPTTPNDLRRWLDAQTTLPWLVEEDDGGSVVGYAIASRWQQREGYDWTLTISVYVHPSAQGRGVGSRLYAELIPRLDALGYRTIIAGIALPNAASVRLHESFGLKHAGTLPRAGFKLGRWIDVGYWVRHFGDGPPDRPRSQAQAT
ncbi:MAG: GNAT family N-acetyltransferase [Phycisphaerales bacterium JB041]